MNERVDYLVAGGGLAGLTFILKLIKEGLLDDKTLLLIEKDTQKSNDRTWCFWNDGEIEEDIAEVVSTSWGTVEYSGIGVPSTNLSLLPYKYNLIRGENLYLRAHSIISQHPSVKVRYQKIQSISNTKSGVTVVADTTVEASWVFTSIASKAMLVQRHKHYLLQHFRGWWVNMDKAVFNPQVACLFDFNCIRNEQDPKGGNTFIYVLPLDERRALVEYTVFSAAQVVTSSYERGIAAYIESKFPNVGYQIDQIEAGVIPMSNHRHLANLGNIVYLGTSAGKTKPSSGYTFSFIQKHNAALCQALKQTKSPILSQKISRFNFYDGIFLRILAEKRLTAEEIFTRMFSRNGSAQILKFLDEETSLLEDAAIMKTLQIGTFTGAALKEIAASAIALLHLRSSSSVKLE